MQKVSLEKNSRLFFLIHSVMDILMVCLGFSTVLFLYSLRFGQDIMNHFIELNILMALVSLIFFKIYTVVRCGRKTYVETILSAGLSLFFTDLTTLLLSLIFIKEELPLYLYFIAFAFQIVYIMLWKSVVYKIYPIFYKTKSVAFIGNGKEAYELAYKIFYKEGTSFKVKYISESFDNDTYKKIEDVDVVFISANLERAHKDLIMNHAMAHGKTVYLVPELYEIAIYNSQMTRFDDVPAFRIESINQTIEHRLVKRILDVSISLFAIIIFAPVMLAVFISVKLTDGGPALYSQERVTIWNKKFKLYKFRSMIVDAEKHTGPTLATDDDPRITKMGKLLRATRLDELPQFFNVLRGDMSIVGPRPERQFFIDQFKETIPTFELRYTVKAGITGLAHVLGKYATTPEDRLRFDLLYITNGFSTIMDLKIILQTVKIMFLKAYSKGVEKTDEKVSDWVKWTESEFSKAKKVS